VVGVAITVLRSFSLRQLRTAGHGRHTPTHTSAASHGLPVWRHPPNHGCEAKNGGGGEEGYVSSWAPPLGGAWLTIVVPGHVDDRGGHPHASGGPAREAGTSMPRHASLTARIFAREPPHAFPSIPPSPDGPVSHILCEPCIADTPRHAHALARPDNRVLKNL
jgi:hypothetical protein